MILRTKKKKMNDRSELILLEIISIIIHWKLSIIFFYYSFNLNGFASTPKPVITARFTPPIIFLLILCWTYPFSTATLWADSRCVMSCHRFFPYLVDLLHRYPYLSILAKLIINEVLILIRLDVFLLSFIIESRYICILG